MECPHRNTGIWPRIRNGLAIRRQAADLYHITGDVYYLALFLPGRRTILTVHDCAFAFHPVWYRRILLKLLWLTLPVRRCAMICAISEKTKEEIVVLTGIDPAKILVVPTAISDRLQPLPPATPADLPVVLQIGTRPNKNVEMLVEALTGMRCHLHIVGAVDEPLRTRLERSGLSWSSEADISEEAMIQAYERASVVAFISTYEGFGMPVVEAQALGRAIVTSDIEPMRSVSGGRAILVDPGNREQIRANFARVLNDPEWRAELVANGFVNADRFKGSRVAAQYDALYREVDGEAL